MNTTQWKQVLVESCDYYKQSFGEDVSSSLTILDINGPVGETFTMSDGSSISLGAVMDNSNQELMVALFSYFWFTAQAGKTFGDVGRIYQRFGKTLEQNYGLDGGPFLQVAYAYWSFAIESDDLISESNHPISVLVREVERKIASLFFPTAGSLSQSVSVRTSAQRDIIRQFAPKLNADRFIDENPLLQKERSTQPTGCLLLLLAPIGPSVWSVYQLF